MRKTESEMNNIFNVIPDAEGGSCTILLYGEIGSYADVTAKETVVQLMEAAKQYSRINLRINSVGGEVATAIAIFNTIRSIKSDVIIYIDCIAASAASFIAACGREVKMSRYAQLMIHRPMGMAFGNADNLKDYTSHLEQIENILCDIYSKRTGMSVDEIKATYMDGQDHWIDAEEAVRLGFADEIYDDLEISVDSSLTPEQKCEHFTTSYLEALNVSHKNNTQMIKRIQTMAAFAKCADEAAVMTKLGEVVAKAEKADKLQQENDSLKEQVKNYQEADKKAKDAAITAEVEAAVQDGRIGENQKEHFVNLLHSNPESAREILNSLKPKKRVPSFNSGKTPEQDRVKTVAELMHEREIEVTAKL